MTWDKAATTDSLPTLGYSLFSNLGITGYSELVYTSSQTNQRSFTHTQLTPGVEYSYWLTVSNFNGDSPDLTLDTASHAKRYACSVPDHFTSLEVSAVSSTEVTLAWSEPGYTGGCPVQSYQVYVDDGAGGAFATASGGLLTSTQYTFTLSGGLDVGATYRFKVEAGSLVESKESNVVSAVIADVPAAPSSGPLVDITNTNK